MDERHFDRIAKGLAVAATRRGVLHVLFSLPPLGTLAALLPGETVAGRRRKARRKRKRKRKQQGCRPEPLAETCADRCGTVRNNCLQPVDCGSCDCDPPCAVCQTCNDAQCQECVVCCDDVCCADGSAVCHAVTQACCVPDPLEVTCDGRCGTAANNCGVAVRCGPCQSCGACPECNCDEQRGVCRPAPIVGKPCGDGQVCQIDGSCSCTPTSCGACRICGDEGVCQPCGRLCGDDCDDR